MALRELMAAITFIDRATPALRAVDSALDDIGSNVDATESSIQGLSDETRLYADSATTDVSEVGNEISNLGDETRGLGDTTSRASDFINRNWTKIAAAVGVAGAAIEGFVRSQIDMLEMSDRLAYSTGMQTEEIRQLALSAQNVTFNLRDVYGTMAVGRQLGITAGDELYQFAKFWDMVADASGESVVELARASVALRAVGVAAGEEHQALAAMGYVITESTSTVGEFLYFLEQMGPQLNELGLDVNQTVAVMSALERELGYTSRTARSEFRRAVNEADGDMYKFVDTLGLTGEQLRAYHRAVQDSGDVVADLAAVHYENYTTAQRLQARVAALTHEYGAHFIPILEILSPILMGLATTMGIAAAAKYIFAGASFAATKAVLAFTVAFLASPLGWVVLGIVAISGALYLLGYRFGDVRRVAEQAWDGITGVIKSAIDWIAGIDLKDIGQNIIDSLTSGITGAIDGLKKGVSDVANTITGGIRGALGISSPSTVMMEFGGDLGAGLYIGMHDATEDFFHRTRDMFSFENAVPDMSGYFSPDTDTEYHMDIVPSRGGTISIGDIHVYSQAQDPNAVAEEVSRVLRREFSTEAERYFGKMNRRR